MVIEFHCPACGNLARSPAAAAGRKGKCPNCDATIQIPAEPEGDSIDEEDLLLGVNESDQDDEDAPKAIEFECKGCHNLVRTPLSTAGKKGRCPNCEAVVRIPKQSRHPAGSVAEKEDVIEFACPQCSHSVRTPKSAEGKKGQCPSCKAVVVIPGPGGKPAQPKAPTKAQPKAQKSSPPKTKLPPQFTADAVTFDCQECGGQVRTPRAAEGKKGKCPHCEAVVQIPTPPRQPAPNKPASKPAASKPAPRQQAASPPAEKPAETPAEKPAGGEGIEFPCPSCKKQVRTPPGSGGKKGKCPHCGLVLRIPEKSKRAVEPQKKKSPAAAPVVPSTAPANKPKPKPKQTPAPPPPDDELSLAVDDGPKPQPAAIDPLAAAAIDPTDLSDIEFDCPSCGEEVATPRQTAGKKGRCPHCQSIFQIPGGNTPSAAGGSAGGSAAGASAGGASPADASPLAGLAPTSSSSQPLGGLTPLGDPPGLAPLGVDSTSATGGLSPLTPAKDDPFDWAAAESTASPAAGAPLGGGGAGLGAGGTVNPFASPSAAPRSSNIAPPDSGKRPGLPWDRKRGDGRFFGTVKMVLFSPSEAFSKMRCADGFGGPIGFLCLSMVVATGATFGYFMLLMIAGSVVGLSNGVDPAQAGASIGGAIFVSLVMFAVGLGTAIPMGIAAAFVHAGILHLLLMMFGGARRGFETTFRVVCYVSGSITMVYVLPYCIAWLPAMICYFISSIIGLARAHSISGGKAALAVCAPMIIPLLLIGVNFLVLLKAIADAAAMGP